MDTKFSITYNTASDWLKAAYATAGAVAGSLALAQVDGLTVPEIIGVVVTGVVTFASALGFYHKSATEGNQAPTNTDPVTFAADNTAEVEANTPANPTIGFTPEETSGQPQ